jgi:His/Glu/Gln/Arg/opine family amino acid ABC transporter permease subunit
VRPSTRKRLFRGVLYAIFILAVAAVILVADWEAIRTNFFNLDVAAEAFPTVVTEAAKNTVVYTVIAFIGGMIGGLILALMKLSPVGPYRWVATAYIELFRGLPALLVIFGFAFAVPIAFEWRPPGGSTGAGLIALIVVSSAYQRIGHPDQGHLAAVHRGHGARRQGTDHFRARHRVFAGKLDASRSCRAVVPDHHPPADPAGCQTGTP